MTSADEWALFRKHGLAFGTQVFTPLDVDADGSCMYHSVVASGVLPITSSAALRTQLVETILLLYRDDGWKVIFNKIFASYNKGVGFVPYLRSLLDRNKWGTDMEMVFIYIAFGVNVFSITNAPFGLNLFSAKNYIELMHIQMPPLFIDTGLCINLYHHLHGRPLMPTHFRNHFCVLFEVTDPSIRDAHYWSAYRGGYVGTAVQKVVPTTTTTTTTTTIKVPKDKMVATKKEKPKSVKAVAAEVAKEKRQTKLSGWNVVPATQEQIASLREDKETRDELDNIGSLIVSDSILGSSLTKKPHHIKGQQKKKEAPWLTKAAYIYFHLHHLLSNADLEVTCALFGVNQHTFKNWLSNPDRIRNWIDLVETMEFEDVLRAIPPDAREQYEAFLEAPYPPIHPKILAKYCQCIKHIKCPVAILHSKSGTASASAKAMYAFARKNPSKAVFVKSNTKRIRVVAAKRMIKHNEVKEFVKSTICERWEQGLAITKAALLVQVVKEFGKRDDEASMSFMGIYGYDRRGGGHAKLNVFLERAIKTAGYSVRETSISQKIPMNWRLLAEQGAQRVRDTFLKEGVTVVVAADEMFVRFHEEDSKVLAPIGEKRIGKSVTCDNKAGCTVMPTMDLRDSKLLPPLIIFNGVFGGRLMKEWAQYTDSFVLFTQNHWMTTETMVLYLRKLMTFYPGDTIGLIIDKAPSHTTSKLDEWITKLNTENGANTRIVLEWVDGGLTSVYQPGDIAVNKPLKDRIKNRYYEYVSEMAGTIKAGDKVKVSREKLVEFVEKSFVEFNRDQRNRKGISQAFRTCGLDPFAENDTDFQAHLDSLERCKVYENLIDGGEALLLDRNAP